MNQVVTKQDTMPMNAVGMSATGTGTKIAPQNLGEVVKFAEVMSRADIALPKHLRGNAGACMAVALQAMEWQLSPFAVASKSYAVNGAIAYEAQLIAAVVNTRSGIKGRLKYQFEGRGADMTCTVSGILDGEECTYTSPRVGDITTKNSPLWKTDPQQQLGYFSARSWARRHCPEVILGVYDRDEAEEFRGPDRAKDITPAFDPLDDAPLTPSKSDIGTGWLSDAGGQKIEPVTDLDDNSQHSEEGSPTSTEEAGDTAPHSPASSPSDQHWTWLRNVTRMLVAATNYGGDLDILKNQKKAALASYDKPDDCPEIITGKAQAVFGYCVQIVKQELEPEDGLAIIAGVCGCEPDDLVGRA